MGFGERPLRPAEVEDAEVADDCVEGTIREGQRLGVAFPEIETWEAAPRLVDHLCREVGADHVSPALSGERGGIAGSRRNVEEADPARCPDRIQQGLLSPWRSRSRASRDTGERPPASRHARMSSSEPCQTFAASSCSSPPARRCPTCPRASCRVSIAARLRPGTPRGGSGALVQFGRDLRQISAQARCRKPEQVRAPLVADAEPAEAQQPRQRPLHDPPVPPEALARLDAAPGDARRDATARRARRFSEESYALSACSLAGRFRGRPGRPRGPTIGGMASTTGSSSFESWTLAAESRTASGMPLRSTTRWYLLPRLPRSAGFGPVSLAPALGPDADAVHARPRPVDGALVAQPVQQRGVQPLPDAGRLPVAQPPPAGRAAPAAQLLGQQPPRRAGAQDEDDAAERGAVGDPRVGRPSASAAPSAAAARWPPRGRRIPGAET